MYIEWYELISTHNAHKFPHLCNFTVSELRVYISDNYLPIAFEWLRDTHPFNYDLLCSESSKEELLKQQDLVKEFMEEKEEKKEE